jgi:hypothetical protein
VGFLSGTYVTAAAQAIFGTVGSVTDQSGAPVPGATIEVTSLSTNEVRSTVSGSAGTYSVPSMPPGTYRVAVQLPGFKQFIRDGVQVQVDVTTRVDVTLEIGNVSEAVTVTGERPLLQTDTSSLGNVVPREAIERIPLNGRNINNLLTLVPGVVAQGSTYGNLVSNQAGGARTNAIGFGNCAIGGGFGNQSSFFVDGVPANAPANNVTGFVPAQDVAFRLTDETVLRGGYGISYPPISLSQDGPNLSAVNSAQTFVSNAFQVQSGSPDQILTMLTNPLPFGVNEPILRNAGPEFFYGDSRGRIAAAALSPVRPGPAARSAPRTVGLPLVPVVVPAARCRGRVGECGVHAVATEGEHRQHHGVPRRGVHPRRDSSEQPRPRRRVLDQRV